MRHLSIADYDALETRARIEASYPALRAFHPAAFSAVNFPIRVTDERELIRYADIMHELAPRDDLRRKAFSGSESEAICKVADQVRDVTQRAFGRPVQALMCLFQPLLLVRAIEAIANARRRRLTVFEIGPGSGYLGAYLMNLGHAYISVDITQSLYLWQNRFFASIARRGREWALDGQGEGDCIHIPWWIYARFHEHLPIRADVVVCDAAMGEMDAFGLRYNLRTAWEMVKSSDCGALIYQLTGVAHVSNRAQITQSVEAAGFRGRRIQGLSIYAPPGRLDDVFPADVFRLPHLGPPGGPVLAPVDFLTLREDEILESYSFFDYVGAGASSSRAAQPGKGPSAAHERDVTPEFATASTPHAVVEAAAGDAGAALALSPRGVYGEHYVAVALTCVETGQHVFRLQVRGRGGARLRAQLLDANANGIAADFDLASSVGSWRPVGTVDEATCAAYCEADEDDWRAVAVTCPIQVARVTVFLQLLDSEGHNGFEPGAEIVEVRRILLGAAE